MEKIIDWTQKIFSHDRKMLRHEVINGFLNEEPGTGKAENCSRYKYIVANLNGHEIYLQRPAQFNNGFDFTLNVSDINFNPNGRATTRPTHDNILQDLQIKKQENFEEFVRLMCEINLLFECQQSNIEANQLNFSQGLPIPILLECIKWLFIEQDVTYWNYSGRKMLFDAISEV